MTIGIVGLGLIGGSLARTIKVHTDFTVLGQDIDPQTMRKPIYWAPSTAR